MKLNKKKNKIILRATELENYIQIDNIDCALEYLDQNDQNKSYSPNGFIFRVKNLQNGEVTSIIKFCNVCEQCRSPWSIRRKERFFREIDALKRVKANTNIDNTHVINLFSSGSYVIDGRSFHYYTMELGTTDLSTFLKEEEISLNQRYLLCSEIIKCIQALHQNGIYHRDIKPKNFLMINHSLKIADLGLVEFREEDISSIDDERERIGPREFMSPEAVNKYLSNLEAPPSIDGKSDVFQLAKVIGFVLQDEIFAGVLAEEDLAKADDTGRLHSLITNAMQYKKGRRYNIQQLQTEFISSFGEKYAFS